MKKKTKLSFDTHLPVPLLLVRCPSINLNLSTHFWDTTTLSWVEEESFANEEIYGGQVEIWFGGHFGE